MRIKHGRVSLELHELARREGPTLLLLHALYGSSDDWSEAERAWNGSVYALDFCGHGVSDWVRGGAYYPELLVGDADVALARLGRATVAGAGLGAYVALLLAGSRPDQVSAALLLPGAGLAGAGAVPDFDGDFPMVVTSLLAGAAANGCDPLLPAIDLTVRPVDYAEPFAHAARRLFLVEDGHPRPPWWAAVRLAPSAQSIPADRFAHFLGIVSRET